MNRSHSDHHEKLDWSKFGLLSCIPPYISKESVEEGITFKFSNNYKCHLLTASSVIFFLSGSFNDSGSICFNASLAFGLSANL